jgi:hypothetical protein
VLITTSFSGATLFGVALAGVVGAAAAGGAGQPSREDVARAQKAVEEYPRLKDSGAAITSVEDEAVGRTLPDHHFFAVLFRQYPVARASPEGLRASNVFAVDKEFMATPLTGAKGLEKFFQSHVTAKTDDQLKDAGRAWLRLTQEFHQDGFYTFKLMDDSTKMKGDKDGRSVSGKVVVMAGGNGQIDATLTFDATGKLSKVREGVELKPGPRPICQATKLLDPDPVVRAIARQDLLIMGRPAREYLDEQRAQASPELRREIDRVWRRIVQENP